MCSSHICLWKYQLFRRYEGSKEQIHSPLEVSVMWTSSGFYSLEETIQSVIRLLIMKWYTPSKWRKCYIFSFICGISSNGSSGLSSSETVIRLIVLYRLRGRLMTTRRTLRTLNAGSVIGGFRIYSKRQGGLRHCSRLFLLTNEESPAIYLRRQGFIVF